MMRQQNTQTNWHNSFANSLHKRQRMGNDKNENTSSQQRGGSGNNGQGRTYNSQDPAVEPQEARRDISGVDQQEGAMNHGETGANLRPENEKQ